MCYRVDWCKFRTDVKSFAELQISDETLVAIANAIASDSQGVVGKAFNEEDFKELFEEEDV